MEYVRRIQIQKLRHMDTRRFTFLLGIIAISVLAIQTLMLPYRNGLTSLFPDGKAWFHGNGRFRCGKKSSPISVLVGSTSIPFSNAPHLNDSSMVLEIVKSTKVSSIRKELDLSMVLEAVKSTKVSSIRKELENDSDTKGRKRILKKDFAYEKVHETENVSLKKNVEAPNIVSSLGNGREAKIGLTLMDKKETDILSEDDKPILLQSESATSNNLTTPARSVIKQYRCNMPPKSVTTISEMNRLLIRRRATYHSVKTQWPSVRDKEIISAKSQIENAPVVRNDRELFAPLFRNVSMFKRSYELMERILKVYIYKEGEKPIFHNAELKGIYASEGWFMKLMEGNQKLLVKDPRKAHLFYMPFSTRMLEYTLYVRNSHNRTNLAQYLKNYTNMIAAKYSFWNRTSGADHFFVACHDWAPYETRHHMERCIKSLCNADVTAGFKIGKDVSLPETYVRSTRNPQKDIGGKPPSERSILAFFAGSMHGYLRPILLSHWENKHPDMKILGRMPPGVASKMTYIEHMKSSKYCICAKGYNVNSPRIVEAIFYECVPVIISDNFVPPFFNVLDWEAFSVIVAEKDIPILKDILLSIPYEKYLALQLGVKQVQRHFLWHSKPMKYDLFNMILHSIWYNRVFMIRPK